MSAEVSHIEVPRNLSGREEAENLSLEDIDRLLGEAEVRLQAKAESKGKSVASESQDVIKVDMASSRIQWVPRCSGILV